ncbi:MAG: TlpA disulfide reductase family protein [Asticcacaulis sp.]
MGEPSDENRKDQHRSRATYWVAGLLIGIVLASVAGGLWWRQAKSETETVSAPAEPVAEGPLKVYATGTLQGLITHAAPKPIENIHFLDGDGNAVQLSDFKGRVVVLNLWATWCTPCRVELPTLAGLQKHYDPETVYVLPLSIDKAEHLEKAREELALSPPLPLYIDSDVQGLSKWGIIGMPTTVILNAEGLEVARFEGDAHWDAPEAKAFIDAVLAQP